jgi:hypothetical protein
MVTVPVVVTNVVTVAVVVFEPAGTVTVAGTFALVGAELERLTTSPPAGAGSLMVMVAIAFWAPPMTDVGLRVTEATENGLTVSVRVIVAPRYAADIVIWALVVRTSVAIAKVAVVPPAGIVTEAGTVAAAVFELVRVMTEPDDGAGPLIVTVPVTEDEPPVTVVTLRARSVSIGGFTVNAAEREYPLRVAVTDPD